MSTKEIQEKIVANMQRWQAIEDTASVQMSEIIAKSKNPVIRQIMEIIRIDSQNHYRVQKLIADSLTTETVTLSPDELHEIWDLIEKHQKTEKRAEEYAQDSLNAIQGKKMVIQEYLLKYLLEDEAKHDRLLDNLEAIKKGVYSVS